MTDRTATAVVLKVTMTTHDGEDRTRYYGPFLPHVGGAATSFERDFLDELEASGLYRDWGTSFEHVFIGPDESDCEIRATR